MLRLLITWLGVFVFCQLNANAELSRLCDQAPATDSPTNCNNTAGCYWNPTGTGNCNFCGKNHYCPKEDTDSKEPIACNTLGGGFDYTEDDGAGDETDCYKNINCYIFNDTKNCTQHYNADGISCSGVFYPFEYNADPKRDYVHLEKASSGSSQTACFTNVISCKKVPTSNYSDCAINESKVAKYYYKSDNSADQYWDISACRCTQQNSSVSGANCKARVTRKPKNDTVSYMTTASPVWEIDSYYCTGCNQGYWANGTQSNDTPLCKYTENDTHAMLCQCFPAQKGYYATGCDLNYPLESSYVIANACPRTPCPAGKTTISQVATSANDCTYSPHTKFCDSKGCFTMFDISNWSEVQ